MISFLKTPEISVFFPKSAKCIVNKSKGNDANHGDKPILFNKHELSLLRKLENYEIPDEEKEEEQNVSEQKENNSKDEKISLTLKGLKEIKSKLNDNVFLCDLLEKGNVELPKNEIVERNPELEERIERLKAQQQNRVYESMVRNVDGRRKHTEPEDSIAFQSKLTKI